MLYWVNIYIYQMNKHKYKYFVAVYVVVDCRCPTHPFVFFFLRCRSWWCWPLHLLSWRFCGLCVICIAYRNKQYELKMWKEAGSPYPLTRNKCSMMHNTAWKRNKDQAVLLLYFFTVRHRNICSALSDKVCMQFLLNLLQCFVILTLN